MFYYNIFYTVGQTEYAIENYGQDAELSIMSEQAVLLFVNDDMKARGVKGTPTKVRVTDTKGNFVMNF